MGFPSFLLFVLLNVYPVYFLKMNFGKSFPFSLSAAVLVYYLGGLAGNLMTGFYLLLLLAAGGLYILIRHYTQEDFRKRFFHLTFFLAVLFFLLVFTLHLNRHFRFIDEFAHLGFMAKESFRLKQFYTVDASNLWYHKDYPPFFTLLEVLWCQCSFAFKDYLCYQAVTFFEFSLFLPLFDRFSNIKKETLRILLLVFFFGSAGFLIGYTDGLAHYTLVYSSIYIDWPVAYLLAFLFYLVTTMELSKKEGYIGAAVLLSALNLSKQICLAFWLLIAVTLTVRCLLNRMCSAKLLWLLTPLLFYFSWSAYISRFDIESAFSFENYDFFVIFTYLKGGLSQELLFIFEKYVDAVMHRGIILRPIPLSYFALSLLLSAGIAAFGFTQKEKKKDILLLAFMDLLGAIGYAYALLLSYLYDFGIIEGPALTMFDRYILTYVLSSFLILIMLVSRVISTSWKKEAVAILILYLFVNIHTISSSRPRWFEEAPYEKEGLLFAKAVEKIEDGKKTVVISQNDVTKQCALRYYADTSKDIFYLDVIHPMAENAFGNGTGYWEDDYWQLMYQYDYIYLCDFDESFAPTYWNMVTDVEPKEDTLYSITHFWDYYVEIEEIK